MRVYKGINLQSSYRGVHVISEVKIGSPADLCGKIDAGDEIMLINGKTVIGWDLKRVAQRIGSNTDGELYFIINKRPRQAVSMVKCASKPARPLAKMAPGSQATNTAEKEKGFLQEVGYPLNRRRSSSFVTELLHLIEMKSIFCLGPAEFAEISVVEPSELVQLNVVEPQISDPDWSAPVNDIAVHSFRAPAGDSNLSGFSLDSPRKTGSELCAKEVTNKWPKCWMCLKGAHLIIYPNQFTQRPDLVINVDKCVVSDATDLKTSKKFVFRLSRSPMEYHFSCYNYTDMRSWMHKIAFASEFYGGHNRIISKSISYFEQEDPFTHYNTMTGLPSLMSQSHVIKPIIFYIYGSPLYNMNHVLHLHRLQYTIRFLGLVCHLQSMFRKMLLVIMQLMHYYYYLPLFFCHIFAHEDTVSIVNIEKYTVAKHRRYFLYDVNHGEGFNLRRDVYMRLANTVRLLRESGENFVLVLPPWGGLYHWGRDETKIRWDTFFDVNSLDQFVPVIEFDDYVKGKYSFEIGLILYLIYYSTKFAHFYLVGFCCLESQSLLIENVIYLQHYKEGWGKEYVMKYDRRDCIDGHKYYKKENDSW
uniref:peptide-O-fucosyltransferase n=1 Tax=Heterorhabditis bacteriophora TaxID=37862 RepID=A0A1I7XAI4_HETBA